MIDVFSNVDEVDRGYKNDNFCLYSLELKSVENVIYKIGMSSHPHQRMKSIQSSLESVVFRMKHGDPKYITGKVILYNLAIGSSIDVYESHKKVARSKEMFAHIYLKDFRLSRKVLFPQKFPGDTEIFGCTENEIHNIFNVLEVEHPPLNRSFEIEFSSEEMTIKQLMKFGKVGYEDEVLKKYFHAIVEYNQGDTEHKLSPTKSVLTNLSHFSGRSICEWERKNREMISSYTDKLNMGESYNDIYKNHPSGMTEFMIVNKIREGYTL